MQNVMQAHSGQVALSYTRVRVESRISITIEPDLSPSPLAAKIIGYVAASDKLSPDEKKSIVRLAAFIDEYAGGDPKLLKQLAGVVQLMEMTAEGRRYARHTAQSMLDYYKQMREEFHRARTGGDGSYTLDLSVEMEFESLTMSYRQVSYGDFMGRGCHTECAPDTVAGSADFYI